ncbi:ABC transporter ATP-binding protein [Nocardia sp. NPDC058379]|uniref:ABC transporter ATP-binding protein n=1 Tax=unclassified Nocardia TaxID=2637762 RepID=UPI0036621535
MNTSTQALDTTVPAGRERPAVELRNVTKQFQLASGRTVTAVNDLSLTIPQGQFVCLVGPSGHGKSTLLNMLAGFTPLSQGQILANGKQVTGPGPDRGVVFQRDTLFLWRRVADNVGFGLAARGVPAAERKRVVDRYLRLTGLERYGRAWPKQLSGGMRRRVAIATVFANEPGILLMDEPFVGLDYARRADLYEVLGTLRAQSNCTVLFITHEIDEALVLGDRMLVMVGGEIALDEPIDLPRPRTGREITSPRAQELKAAVIARLDAAQIQDEA